MKNRKKILITNDDGIHAKGLSALISIASAIADVVVVAPHMPRSGMSTAITVDKPIRIEKFSVKEGVEMYSCTGTPVDCVKIAFSQVLTSPPDLILSGINHGSNSSVNIHYSGTMGAVIEGCMHDIPSIGFSLCDHSSNADFLPLYPHFSQIILSALEKGLPIGTCLNVNAPKGTPTGIKYCRQGKGRWVEEFDHRTDPHGRDYFWITGCYENLDNGSIDTDNHAIAEGFIAVVPVITDMTDYPYLKQCNSSNL